MPAGVPRGQAERTRAYQAALGVVREYRRVVGQFIEQAGVRVGRAHDYRIARGRNGQAGQNLFEGSRHGAGHQEKTVVELYARPQIELPTCSGWVVLPGDGQARLRRAIRIDAHQRFENQRGQRRGGIDLRRGGAHLDAQRSAITRARGSAADGGVRANCRKREPG